MLNKAVTKPLDEQELLWVEKLVEVRSAVDAKLAIRPKPFWENALVVALVSGLILALVGAYFDGLKRQSDLDSANRAVQREAMKQFADGAGRAVSISSQTRFFEIELGLRGAGKRGLLKTPTTAKVQEMWTKMRSLYWEHPTAESCAAQVRGAFTSESVSKALDAFEAAVTVASSPNLNDQTEVMGAMKTALDSVDAVMKAMTADLRSPPHRRKFLWTIPY